MNIATFHVGREAPGEIRGLPASRRWTEAEATAQVPILGVSRSQKIVPVFRALFSIPPINAMGLSPVASGL